ncbi:MAG: ferredoxin-thioredoxin reductase catalytic domain-containing protein [Candidatus Lernaella stagnicola]|nr:ferredoxin-thioredoxin reductase catalytic domain-containing protein [Candidatus Lernaella stagnicola]
MSKKPKSAADLFELFKQIAERKGLHFNPNADIVRPLIDGLWKNKQRYGHPSCPCRLSSEDFDNDRDIICPCDYSEPDIEEYGQCYCGLFVHRLVVEGNRQTQEVPERRPAEKMCY